MLPQVLCFIVLLLVSKNVLCSIPELLYERKIEIDGQDIGTVIIYEGFEPVDVISDFMKNRQDLPWTLRNDILIDACSFDRVSCSRTKPIIFVAEVLLDGSGNFILRNTDRRCAFTTEEEVTTLTSHCTIDTKENEISLGILHIMEGQQPVDVIYSFCKQRGISWSTPSNLHYTIPIIETQQDLSPIQIECKKAFSTVCLNESVECLRLFPVLATTIISDNKEVGVSYTKLLTDAQLESHIPNKKVDNIPKIIHQMVPSENISTWHTDWINAHKTWNLYFPPTEYKHILWTDVSLRQWVKNDAVHMLELYDSYPKQIMRVDLARYLILQKIGGIYADMDYVCNANFYKYLSQENVHIVASANSLNEDVQNALMASPPRHPFWEVVLVEAINSSHMKDVLNATGPRLLSRAFGIAPSKVTILAKSYFNPINNVDVTDFKSESEYFAKHLNTRHWLREYFWEDIQDPVDRAATLLAAATASASHTNKANKKNHSSIDGNIDIVKTLWYALNELENASIAALQRSTKAEEMEWKKVSELFGQLSRQWKAKLPSEITKFYLKDSTLKADTVKHQAGKYLLHLNKNENISNTTSGLIYNGYEEKYVAAHGNSPLLYGGQLFYDALGNLPSPLPSNIYLNIGAGDMLLPPPWINIDKWVGSRIEKNSNYESAPPTVKIFWDSIGIGKNNDTKETLQKRRKIVVGLDVGNMWELPDGSVSQILAKDILEHFKHAEVETVLSEWHRVLQPCCGTLQVIVPSLTGLCKNLINGVWKADLSSYYIFGGQKSPGDIHSVGFSEESLERHLEAAGFDVAALMTQQEVVDGIGENHHFKHYTWLRAIAVPKVQNLFRDNTEIDSCSCNVKEAEAKGLCHANKKPFCNVSNRWLKYDELLLDGWKHMKLRKGFQHFMQEK